MEVLWAAVAICAIVSLAFYVLAASWQRMLKRQSRAIRDLLQRVDALESMEDPFVRRRIGELVPSPLEEVYVLSFQLSERFWQGSLGATEKQMRYVHEHGTFVGSVKMEMWRTHIAVTVTELLPQRKSGGWQARTVDIYGADSMEPKVLWQLCLTPDTSWPTAETSSVELRYENQSLVLEARPVQKRTWPESLSGEPADKRIIFCIPLNAERLAEFRNSDTKHDGTEYPGDPPFEAGDPHAYANVASFSHQDERQGVGWQLHIRELNGRTASEQWTIMESPRVRRVS